MAVRARKLQRLLFDGGFAGICLPDRVRRPGSAPRLPAGVHPGVDGLPDAHHLQRPHADHPGPDPPRLRDRGAEAAPHPGHPPGRRAVGAVPLRAQRRLRSGRPGHHGHPGRRRLRPQRVEDLEFGRVPGRLRALPGPDRLERAQAPGPDHVHRQDPPARYRGAADQDGQRHGRVLPGVLRRRAHPGRRRRRAASTTGGRWRRGCCSTSGTRWGVARPTPAAWASGDASKGGQRSELEDLARATGQTADPRVRQLLAEARVNDRVQSQLIERVSPGHPHRGHVAARPAP